MSVVLAELLEEIVGCGTKETGLMPSRSRCSESHCPARRNMRTLSKAGNNMRNAVLFVLLAGFAGAQAPTGTIAGVVRDPSGAAVAGARVKAQSVTTAVVRTAISSEQGDYSFPALLAGEYEVSVEASGFQRMARLASVESGASTMSDFVLRVGEVSESVTVDSASPQIRYDSHTVGGLVTRRQIENLPLNGRSFLELAKLEPGVQPPSRASSNRIFVPVLGAPGGNNGRGTRVTVDGGSIMAVGNGGSAMGFSQEVVQEFQISTANFDLSTGLTFSGAINVVTRSGTNDIHVIYMAPRFTSSAITNWLPIRLSPATLKIRTRSSSGGSSVLRWAAPFAATAYSSLLTGSAMSNEESSTLLWRGTLRTSAASRQARSSAISSACVWMDVSPTRTQHFSATHMMALRPSHRLPRYRMRIHRLGLAS